MRIRPLPFVEESPADDLAYYRPDRTKVDG
jgi:hypothetical protein